MLEICGTFGASKSTGSAAPTVSSSDFPVPFSCFTCSTEKSYGAPAPPVSAPCEIHCEEVCAQSAHHTPYGATSCTGALFSCEAGRPLLLYAGTKARLRYQPPFLPACTQWPAVHTMLDLPGCAGSFTTVAEQTMWPWGLSKKTLPTGAALRVYGSPTGLAWTGWGSASVTPWSSEKSFVPSVLSLVCASFIVSGFQWPLMIGLTKSRASRSQSSLLQFFQAPFFHLSRSWRDVGRSLGSLKPPSSPLSP